EVGDRRGFRGFVGERGADDRRVPIGAPVVRWVNEAVVASHEASALDEVLELADVPRPVVGVQPRRSGRMKPTARLVMTPRPVVEEMLREQAYVARPLAQRRQADAHD